MEIRLERLTGDDLGIVLLGLDRPEAKNALGRRLMDEFRQAITELRFDPSVRVVVVQYATAVVYISAPPGTAAMPVLVRAAGR